MALCSNQLFSGIRAAFWRSRQKRQADMQKEIIIQKLKECGYRVTKQRLMLLDVILEEECSCCKDARGRNCS